MAQGAVSVTREIIEVVVTVETDTDGVWPEDWETEVVIVRVEIAEQDVLIWLGQRVQVPVPLHVVTDAELLEVGEQVDA